MDTYNVALGTHDGNYGEIFSTSPTRFTPGMSYEGTYLGVWNSFVYFANTAITAEDTISSAILNLYVDTIFNPYELILTIYGDKSVSATAPTSTANGEAKIKTSNYCQWLSYMQTGSTGWYTFNVTSVVNELKNISGWNAGNKTIGFLITPSLLTPNLDPSFWGDLSMMSFKSQNNATVSHRPYLTIDPSHGAGGGAAVCRIRSCIFPLSTSKQRTVF